MPKNTGKGGNKRKKAKKQSQEARELVYKGEMEEYGQVLRLLGDLRLEINCMDGVKRIGHIRGKMKKKCWIANGDVVLVSLREFDEEKCDVVHKYFDDEVRKLKKAGELPDSLVVREADEDEDNEEKGNDGYGDIVFEDEEPQEDEKEKKKKTKKKDDDEDDKKDDEDNEEDGDINIDDL
ncbi:MAG: translation initiation factor eIF-1A [archaeon]|nr:translation initiation factor eIF-1A [archaeon]